MQNMSGKICALHDDGFLKTVRCVELIELTSAMFNGPRARAKIVTYAAGQSLERYEFLFSSPPEIYDAYEEAGLEAFAPFVIGRSKSVAKRRPARRR